MTETEIVAICARQILDSRGNPTVEVEVALEGDWTPDRVVLLKFPSVESARRFNDSVEYAAARKSRQGAAVMRMTLIEGV